MSKASDGPAATSFSNPRKTGWLHKRGGSGMSSHWKKRFFIVDHSYLFYYKGPNDKKPVGILCLPEYASCHKADPKEWKKQHSFMVDKGSSSQNSDATDGPMKSYVLHTESGKEMDDWIKAISEEMKSGGMHGFSNGDPVTRPRQGSVKIDPKAFDELTVAATTGPKLSHLTTQRPKMKGRRPPKRYATYHEEEQESPPPSPRLDGKPSPTESPSASPSAGRKEKGHRPSVPLKPKPRASTNAKPLEENGTAVENETARVPPETARVPPETARVPPETARVPPETARVPPETPKKPTKPLPPKKPPGKDELAASAESGKASHSPEPVGRPSPTPRPTPPKKPSKELPKEPPQPLAQPPSNEAETEPAAKKEPLRKTSNTPLPRKPRPMPPAKPRSSTSASAIELSPVPPSPSQVSAPSDRPTPAPRPVPRKRMKSVDTALKEPVVEVKEDIIEEVEEVEEVSKPPSKPVEEKNPPLPAEAVEGTQEVSEEGSDWESAVYKNVETELQEPKVEEDISKVTEMKESVGIESQEGTTEPRKQEYVNLTILPDNVEAKGSEAAQVPRPVGTVSSEQPSVKPTGAVMTEDVLSPGYVCMDPTSLQLQSSPEDAQNQEPLSLEIYEVMKSGIHREKSSAERTEATSPKKEDNEEEDEHHEYQVPRDWGPPPIEGKIPPLLPHNDEDKSDDEYVLPPDSHTDYNIPPPPRSEDIYDVPRPHTPSKSPDPTLETHRLRLPTPVSGGDPLRPSGKDEADGEQIIFDLEEEDIQELVIQHVSRTPSGSSTGSSARGSSTPTAPGRKMETDGFGYTKVKKTSERAGKQTSHSSAESDVEDKSAAEWVMVEGSSGEVQLESSLDSIPATLKQAREILRLAKVVKAEADETKQEALRELELARREKQDAELLKQNAAEILRMAKERLHMASKC